MLPAARIAGLIFLLAAATASAQPATQGEIVATPGFDGRWTVGHWAPLRLTFTDPGPVDRVELFCNDAGPTFLAPTTPAPIGRSDIDLAVYAQVPGNAWTVRLTGRDGTAREAAVDLGVDFSGYRGESPAPEGWSQSARIAARAAERASPEVFGPPERRWTVDPDFYEIVWPADAAQIPPAVRLRALVPLAGGLLAILAIALLIRRRRKWAIGLSAGVLGVAAAAGLWWMPNLPGHRVDRVCLVTHSTTLSSPDTAGDAALHSRTQQWTCVAAYRDGTVDVDGQSPGMAGRCVVDKVSARPPVTLGADRASIRLSAGGRQALLATDYAPGRVNAWPRPGNVVMLNAETGETLADAWLVADTRATRVVGGGPLNLGEQSAIELTPTGPTRWSDVYQTESDDGAETRLRKRLLQYWSTRTPRGGRYWLVGWVLHPDPGIAGELWVIDLGPIEQPTAPAVEPADSREPSSRPGV